MRKGRTDRGARGDRVCTMPGISCGSCLACLSGDVMGCKKLRVTGFGEIGGGYAEYALGGERMTFRLPDRVASADGAMVEPLAVGLHAVDVAGLASGRRSCGCFLTRIRFSGWTHTLISFLKQQHGCSCATIPVRACAQAQLEV